MEKTYELIIAAIVIWTIFGFTVLLSRGPFAKKINWRLYLVLGPILTFFIGFAMFLSWVVGKTVAWTNKD